MFEVQPGRVEHLVEARRRRGLAERLALDQAADDDPRALVVARRAGVPVGGRRGEHGQDGGVVDRVDAAGARPVLASALGPRVVEALDDLAAELEVVLVAQRRARHGPGDAGERERQRREGRAGQPDQTVAAAPGEARGSRTGGGTPRLYAARRGSALRSRRPRYAHSSAGTIVPPNSASTSPAGMSSAKPSAAESRQILRAPRPDRQQERRDQQQHVPGHADGGEPGGALAADQACDDADRDEAGAGDGDRDRHPRRAERAAQPEQAQRAAEQGDAEDGIVEVVDGARRGGRRTSRG